MARRAGLDRASVIEAAASIADRDGLQAVTLTTLAMTLGVQTPSLYNHVAGLPDLRRALAIKGLQDLDQIAQRAAVGRTAGPAVGAIAHAYRAYVHAHPGLYAATVRAPDPADAEMRALSDNVVGNLLVVLEGCGLRGDDALHAVRAFRSLLHGFVSLESMGGFGLPLDCDETFRRLIAGFIAGFSSS